MASSARLLIEQRNDLLVFDLVELAVELRDRIEIVGRIQVYDLIRVGLPKKTIDRLKPDPGAGAPPPAKPTTK